MAGKGNHRIRASDASDLQRAFGVRLRWLRLAWEEREPGQHSQEAWAEALGVHFAAISRWETGRYSMPIDLVWRVVLATGATWDFLYGGVVGDGMEPWLAAHLRQRYPAAIVEQKALRLIRDEHLATSELRRFRVPKRLGRPPTRGSRIRRRRGDAEPPRTREPRSPD